MDHMQEMDFTVPADLDESVGILQLITGESDDKPFWAYALMYPSKYMAYVAKVEAREDIIIGDYGLVIETGWGIEPPVDVRKAMEEQYGADDNFQDELEKTFHEALEQAKKEQMH